MAFPTSANNNDTHERYGVTYKYSATTQKWTPFSQTAESVLSKTSISTFSDIDLTTSAPINGQALTWDANQNKFVPRSIGVGTLSYATVAELPLSGNQPGAKALVQETNRLYLWNGTGWFSIALVAA